MLWNMKFRCDGFIQFSIQFQACVRAEHIGGSRVERVLLLFIFFVGRAEEDAVNTDLLTKKNP